MTARGDRRRSLKAQVDTQAEEIQRMRAALAKTIVAMEEAKREFGKVEAWIRANVAEGAYPEGTLLIDILLAEVERLKAEITRVIGAAQRFQPPGSPPPGDGAMLVTWICHSLAERAERAEARLCEVADALKPGQSRYSLHQRIAAALAAVQPEEEK